ncbi:hypothetical protein GHT91_00005, partial [Acinetobacter baumannii]|nr:hypothetical protein [Acinetobacter baumannii]
MNQVYRVIWSTALGAWVAVSELAKSQKKSKSLKVCLVVPFLLVSAIAEASTFNTDGGSACNGGSSAIVYKANPGIPTGQAQDGSGNYSAVAGCDAKGNGNLGVTVYGSFATANGTGAVAVGNQAAAGKYAVAVGVESKANADGTVAIGAGSLGSAINSVAVGRDSVASANNAIAVGFNTASKGVSTISIGTNAAVIGTEATAIGANSSVNGNTAQAIGRLSQAWGAESLAFGAQAQAGSSGDQNNVNSSGDQIATGDIAIGGLSKATGTNSVALGRQAIADNYSLAFGPSANATNISIAIGPSAVSTGNRAIALGANAIASLNSAVALGSNSTTATNATTVANATLNNLNYGTFAGQVTGPGRQVSVGSVGAERQLKNVGSGAISQTSTDAINGSQLYATNTVLGNVANSTIDILGGDATLNSDGNLSMNNIGGTGQNTIDSAIAASRTEVAAGTNVADVVKTTGSNGQDIYTVNAQGTSASAGSSAVTVTAGTPDANNVTDYAVDLSQGTKDSLVKADTALQSVVTQIDGVDVKTVNKDDNKVNFVTGDNVELTANADGSITVGTAADV